MAFDLSGALSASRSLSHQNVELAALKRALIKYQNELHACWSGSELAQIDIAINKIVDKISRAQRQIDSTCNAMNRGAAALKTKQDTEALEAKARGISGGGGGGGGGRGY